MTARRTLLLAVSVALLCAAPARADTVPFADDGALPWASGTSVRSPLEQFATRVAAKLANVPNVEIRCEGDTDWNALAADYDFDPRFELGYVIFYRRGSGPLYPGTLAELSPFACQYLQRYALAGSKPTKCETVTRKVETVYRTVTVTKRTRVKVKGKWVIKTVTMTKQVPQTVEREVKGPPAPCYVNASVAASMPESFWDEYDNYAQAILTLAHESAHLGGVADEAVAECRGMQWMPYVASQLGTTPDDAQAIARYTFDKVFPYAKGTEYWSPDCRDGGPLDLTPGDGVWP